MCRNRLCLWVDGCWPTHRNEQERLEVADLILKKFGQSTKYAITKLALGCDCDIDNRIKGIDAPETWEGLAKAFPNLKEVTFHVLTTSRINHIVCQSNNEVEWALKRLAMPAFCSIFNLHGVVIPPWVHMTVRCRNAEGERIEAFNKQYAQPCWEEFRKDPF